MIEQLSPEIPARLLGKIIDEVFDFAIEDPSVIEDIYRAIAKDVNSRAATKALLPDLAAGVEGALRKFEIGYFTIFEAMAAITAASSQYKAACAEVSHG